MSSAGEDIGVSSQVMSSFELMNWSCISFDMQCFEVMRQLLLVKTKHFFCWVLRNSPKIQPPPVQTFTLILGQIRRWLMDTSRQKESARSATLNRTPREGLWFTIWPITVWAVTSNTPTQKNHRNLASKAPNSRRSVHTQIIGLCVQERAGPRAKLLAK